MNSLHLKHKLTKTASCQADTVVVRVTSCLIVFIVSTKFFFLVFFWSITALKSLLDKAGFFGFFFTRKFLSHLFIVRV